MKFNSFLLTTASITSFLLPTLTQAMDRDDHKATGGSTPTSAPHAVFDEVSSSPDTKQEKPKKTEPQVKGEAEKKAPQVEKIFKDLQDSVNREENPKTLSVSVSGIAFTTGLSPGEVEENLPLALRRLKVPETIETLWVQADMPVREGAEEAGGAAAATEVSASQILEAVPSLKNLKNIRVDSLRIEEGALKNFPVALETLTFIKCKLGPHALEEVSARKLVIHFSEIEDLPSVLAIKGLEVANLFHHVKISLSSPLGKKENPTLRDLFLNVPDFSKKELKKLLNMIKNSYPNLKKLHIVVSPYLEKEKKGLFIEKNLPDTLTTINVIPYSPGM